MKEQILSATLPELPIVGKFKLETRDGKTLYSIKVVEEESTSTLDPFFQHCFEEFEKFLSGKSTHIDIKLDETSLTPFQKEVLKAMKEIPYGQVATYKDLAQKLNSKAFQAIGSACGRNPFMLIYPCHRVLGTNNLGGFAHGLTMKKQLLELENMSRHK